MGLIEGVAQLRHRDVLVVAAGDLQADRQVQGTSWRC
jgi:hypothetical protein